jgi:uncharacterized protein (DUF1684 family)
MKYKLLFFTISVMSLLLYAGENGLPGSEGGDNHLEQREEKLKAFRLKRDQFFKNDSHSPLKESAQKKFKALIYYPIDLKYAVTGSIEKYPTDPKPIYVNLPTNKEREKKYVKYGRFKFKLDNKEYILHIYRPLGGGELFLPFKDKTSGIETYPEGRYLNIEPMPSGKVLIDFNRAYNPFCEYNEKFTCPFAPKENWLDIEIRAGEKRFR